MMRDLLELIDELVQRYRIPTRSCVLSHVTNALEVMRQGAPIDLVFQSIAGTEIANRVFGIDLGILAEAYDAALSLKRGTVGQNDMDVLVTCSPPPPCSSNSRIPHLDLSPSTSQRQIPPLNGCRERTRALAADEWLSACIGCPSPSERPRTRRAATDSESTSP